jgi:hypothetical protein
VLRSGKAQPYRTAGAVGAGEWMLGLVGAGDFFTPSQPYRTAGAVGAGEWMLGLVGAGDFFTPSQPYRTVGGAAAGNDRPPILSSQSYI